MSELKAVGSFDKEKGTLTIVIDLTGHSPIEHEMLAAAFDERSVGGYVIERDAKNEILRGVRLEPTHDGDELSATLTIFDPALWDRAVRAETNRQRKADGKPTLDEEESQALAIEESNAKQKAAADDAAAKQKKADDDAAAKKIADDEARDQRLAASVAVAVASQLNKKS